MNSKFAILFVLFSVYGFSQEICDNGIDDDWDGKIDLQDEECDCGLGLNPVLVENSIPNQNFDTSSCCPGFYNTLPTPVTSLSCLDSWDYGAVGFLTTPGVSYASSCDTCAYPYYFYQVGPPNGTITVTTPYANILPPDCYSPVQNGMVSIFGNTNYYNYLGQSNATSSINTCLYTPLVPGYNYCLQLDLFNCWPQMLWNPYQIIDLSLLGAPDCASVPLSANTGPGNGCFDPNWVTLDSMNPYVTPDSSWHTFSFNFQTQTILNAMSISWACEVIVPPSYDQYNRFLMDNLVLKQGYQYDAKIEEVGAICSNDHYLVASIDTTGGTWQWYQDSVALVGETDDSLSLLQFGQGTNTYTAVYHLNGNCQGAVYEYTSPYFPYTSATAYDACVGEPISFDGSAAVFNINGNTITDYMWDFGSGDTLYVEDPVYAYDTPGNYDIQFVAYTDQGCPDTTVESITIYPLPIVDFTVTGSCIYDEIEFTNNSSISTGSISAINWDFGDNTSGTNNNESHQYGSFGLYNVELFATSDLGCADSLSLPIYINPAPVSSFSAVDTCLGDSQIFINNSTISAGNIVSDQWDFGDNTGSMISDPSHVYNTTGIYDVELIVESDSGCVDTSNLQIEVHPNPTVGFEFSTSCYFTTFVNQSNIVAGSIASYNWDFGDMVSSLDISPFHLYANEGNFPVTLTAASDFGCMTDTTITVPIIDSLIAGITANITAACHGTCIEFYDSSLFISGKPNYLWTFSDGQDSELRDPVMCFQNNTEVPISVSAELVVTTTTGCRDTISLTDYIQIVPKPVAKFSVKPTTLSINDPKANFINESVNASAFDWNFGDNTGSSETNPTHVYEDISKSYTVTLTAYSEDDICTDIYAYILTVEDDLLFYIPNVFTPNQTGINDEFYPVFYSGIDIYQFKFEIFNRWGELMFVSYDPDGRWDGRYNGDIVQDGTYVWKVSFNESMTDKTHIETGTVTVLR